MVWSQLILWNMQIVCLDLLSVYDDELLQHSWESILSRYNWRESYCICSGTLECCSLLKLCNVHSWALVFSRLAPSFLLDLKCSLLQTFSHYPVRVPFLITHLHQHGLLLGKYQCQNNVKNLNCLYPICVTCCSCIRSVGLPVQSSIMLLCA